MKKALPTTRQNGFSLGGVLERSQWFKVSTVLALAAMLATPKPAAAAPYTWNVTSGNWSTPTSWNPTTTGPNGPLATDTVVFGINNTSPNSTTVNNVVDAGFAGTIASLTYNSTNANAFHVTQIGPNQTLTVTNSIVVGLQNGVQLITQAYMVGGGTLVATVTNFQMQSYGSASGANSSGNLDLTGLKTFIYNNTNGTISIADVNSLTRAGGNLSLAGTSNNISANIINVATSAAAQAGPNCSLFYGAGTNIINVRTMNIANNKGSATNTFKVAGGGLRLRGASGVDTDRANITLGNRNQSGTGTCAGNMLFNGSTVDIKAATLIVGTNNSAGTTGDTGTGVLQFDTGTVDATTVIMGASVTALGAANGTITVGTNGKLLVGAGGLSLVTQTASGAANGTLNISNGTVVCTGSITVGSVAGNGTINLISGGKLSLAANSFAGTLALPVNNLNLDTNSILEFTIPSLTQTNIAVNNLTWPTTDTALTFTIDGLPAGITPGTVIPLIQFGSLLGGPVATPVVNLPAGVTGALTSSGNTIILTITGGVGPGVGGINQLANPGFELTPLKTNWTTAGNTPVITVGSATYFNSPTGPCPDASAQLVVSHSGTNVANIYGAFSGSFNIASWGQTLPTVAGSTFTAGAYTYVSHEDLMSGKNSFHYAVNFLDSDGLLLASYQSYVVSNLTCGETTPFPLDTWVLLAVTNQMQVTSGTNTGVVTGNIPSSVLMAPPGTASVQFQALFVQQGPPNQYDGGSVYLDDANLGLLGGPVAPTLTPMTPSLVTLCTNTALTATATSSVTAITNVQVIVKTTTLGGLGTNTVTNGLGSASLTVNGIGTGTANISFALATNTIYRSIVIKVTDANGITVASPANVLDTLQPTLVIEASDFNFSNGMSIDTPANGGLALYTNQVGNEGVDEHKAPRANTQSYYRQSDAVIIQGAAPNTGNPPTGTEQKFVTAAANGDTNDIEVEVGYNTPNDWLNYTRTFGAGGSAPAGTYNIWCYLATSGSGIEEALSQVTSDPTQGNQTSNFLGNFGGPTFTDGSYNSFVYVPLVDQFGNRVAVTLGTGQQTLKSTVVGNPNLGLYILVPVTPILTPSLQHVYPDGTVPYQTTNLFSFTVGPAQGAPISSSGIGLVLNGVDVSAGLSLSQSNGSWTATYPIQSNAVYTGIINVTNNASLSASFPLSFDTFNVSNFMWEAVDYDFSTNNGSGFVSGLFIDNPMPTCDTTAAGTGTTATNSYFGYPSGVTPGTDPFGTGAVAQQGIDIHFPDDGQAAANQIFYRNDGVGSQPATDYLRPKFKGAQQALGDPNIGQFNIGYYGLGYWMNYTRTYPTNNFNVWGRLAGGGGAFSGTTLSVVTSGVGTPNQTSNVIGSFADAAPSGWQSYHWIPLRDTNGNMAVLPLAGKATLKVTSGNNLNPLFFMLTPAPIRLTLATTVSGGQINISIPTQMNHNYTLLHATTLLGSYTQVGSVITGDGQTHMVSQPTSGTQGFYRVLVQ